MKTAFGLRIVSAAIGLAIAASGCGEPCAPPAKACPVLPNPPQKGPIKIVDLLAGFENGGSGSGSFTVPILPVKDVSVTVTCGNLKIQKDKPDVGKTKITGSCTFKKLGMSGTADLEIIVDKDGNGHIAATGNADLVLTDIPINVWVELKGGHQVGQTVTVSAEANGQCFTATLTRDGDKLIVEADNPKTKIEVTKK